MKTNWGAWVQGLVAAVVGAFATAATGALTLPGVFNFSHNGMINFLKISVTPAIYAFFAYLQQHPTPADTTTLKQLKTAADGTTLDTTLIQTKTPPAQP